MSKSVWSSLRERFSPPAWAYFEEVRNGTGFSRRVTRTADALAFSLYPSRGLELHGFEVKVSRGDWLREKDDPEKAEEIARFCERWWLVTTKGCVLDKSEIPPNWGWLEFDGKKLVQRKEAPAAGAVVALDKPMIAAILRKACDGQSALIDQAVRAQLDDRMEHEREVAAEVEAKLTKRVNDADAETSRAVALLHQVEVLVGDRLFSEGWPRQPLKELPTATVEMIKLARQSDLVELRAQLERTANELRDAAVRARLALRPGGVKSKQPRRFRGAA